MIVVGLTGTLGAGKSTVGRHFEQWGALRLDADQVAREAVSPSSPGLARIREAFGTDVIAPDGGLAREAMRRLAFSDPAALARLEEIVHPVVERLLRARLDAARRAGKRIAVLEVPLLLEKGLDELCDLVVVVDAPPGIRRGRLEKTRGLPVAEFERIEAAQWPAGRKREMADVVLVNDSTPEALERRAREAWRVIEARTGDAAGPTEPSEDRRWRVDLHTHTDHSHDCLSRAAQVVARAEEVGLDRIAITDHNEIDGALEARALDPRRVIVGEEVRTAEGLDLIGLFLTRHIPPGGTFEEVAAEIRGQGGVVYLPHPFDRHRGTTEGFLDGVVDWVDAVEALNARVHEPARNARATAWARARGLPVGAGSDAHLLSEIGRARVRLRPFEGPAEFLVALRSGRIEGEASPAWVHLGSTWAKIRKRLPL